MPIKIFTFICVSALLTITGVMIARAIIIDVAKNKSTEISTYTGDTEQYIESLTTDIHKIYTQNKNVKDFPVLFKLRPYLTNKRLPSVLRFPEGAIETIYPYGWCDNAARMMIFALSQKGLSAKQWNMITPVAGHSALVIDDNGREIFADPFYGILFQNSDGEPISSQKGKALFSSGETPLKAISKESNTTFYQDFDKVMMAAQSEPLEMATKLENIDDVILLGSVDGSSTDVHADGVKNKITPYWTYMGHRYDKSWVRSLKLDQPVRIDITLVKKPSQKIITSNKKPQIKGNTLTWNLKAGEVLIFKDGNSSFLWSELKSYIEVDQIKITPTKVQI